jgi:hypothetical protein
VTDDQTPLRREDDPVETWVRALTEVFVWKRIGVAPHYKGWLRVDPERLRLAGYEQGTTIFTTMWIPFEDVDAVRLSDASEEAIEGVHGIVLELDDQRPMLVRADDPEADAEELQRLLRAAVFEGKQAAAFRDRQRRATL